MNGTLAQLACLWEASARKIGNVHPKASFAGTTYLDFVTSAVAIGPAFASSTTLGMTVLNAVETTRGIVHQNTNLGMILLLAGILFPPRLASESDTEQVFRAISLANPGGLGDSEHDVRKPPEISLFEAMSLAANRDVIARQFVNDFFDVHHTGVPALLKGFASFHSLEAAIIHCQLAWLSAFPDSLIARKNGNAIAEDVQRQVQSLNGQGGLMTPAGRAAGIALDSRLRSEGNRLNPGTSADLVAACLFVALREGKIPLDAPFPWKVEDWL